MKPALLRTVLVMSGALLPGAAFTLSAQDQEAPRAVFVTPATPEEKKIQGAGEFAIDRLAVSMANEVRGALAMGNLEDAVDICHLTGLAKKGTVPGLPRIIAVKFTSLKIRTPANTPDAADKLALDYFDRTPAAGSAPAPLLVQRIDAPDSEPEWRVYKPVAVSANCLACHGNTAAQSPALRARLNALYPNDKATGYRVGEWRGVIRVTVAGADDLMTRP
jgi:hypothetical protein